jgi:outer membrane protein, multidrug efflux system
MSSHHQDHKPRTKIPTARLLLVPGLLFLNGCISSRESSQSLSSTEAMIPGSWSQVETQESSIEDQVAQGAEIWWRQFQDPELAALTSQALAHNRNLQSALLRIEQVRAQRDLARIQRLPSISAAASASGTHVEYLEGDGNQSSDSASASVSTSWEADLFGRIRLGIDSAESNLLASAEDYRGAKVALTAEVASSYLNLRALQSQVRIVKETIAMRETTLEITRWQEESGSVNALQVQQAIVSLEQAKTSLPSIERSMAVAWNALELLCGSIPGSLRDGFTLNSPLPSAPVALMLSFPAEILGQRPDIRAQRHRIHAASANLGAANKERLPSLTLSGSIGINEDGVIELFNPARLVFNAAARLSAPLWDAGRIEQSILQQDLALQQAYLSYESLILTALAEVENALVSIQKTKEQKSQVKVATDAARLTAEIAAIQYEAGAVDLLTLLDAQRSLLSLEQSMINSEIDHLIAHIQLFRSTGGGWTSNNTFQTLSN